MQTAVRPSGKLRRNDNCVMPVGRASGDTFSSKRLCRFLLGIGILEPPTRRRMSHTVGGARQYGSLSRSGRPGNAKCLSGRVLGRLGACDFRVGSVAERFQQGVKLVLQFADRVDGQGQIRDIDL